MYSTEILLNIAMIREVNSTEIDSNFSAAPAARQAEPHKHPIYGKQKETHKLIFSWLSWLAVLLVGNMAAILQITG